MFPKVTLVLGGASSGKSAFAERLVASQRLGRVYVATAQAHDDEMETRISRHQKMRGTGWDTIEEPMKVAATLAPMDAGRTVLLDCATLWLSNHMAAGNDLAQETVALLDALATCRSPVVVVSNEVGHGIVPDNALARQFRDAQGKLNQQIAEIADLVVLVVAGLPLVIKGALPAGLA